jgi:hypothetical protein
MAQRAIFALSPAELTAKDNGGNSAPQRNSSPEKRGAKGKSSRAGGGVHQTAGSDVLRT